MKAIKSQKEISFTQEIITKNVHYAYVDGQKLELFDLLETLQESTMGRMAITNKNMIQALKFIGVLEYEGDSNISCIMNEEKRNDLIPVLEHKEFAIYEEMDRKVTKKWREKRECNKLSIDY